MTVYHRIIVSITSFLIACALGAQNRTSSQMYELPTYSGEPFFYSAYTVQFNTVTNIPDWVAWKLDLNRVSNNNIFSREAFRDDPTLQQRSPHSFEYNHTSYDRGHMCPANDCPSGKMAIEASYMSNVCPQSRYLNEHSCWRTLEEKCKTWVADGHFEVLYIICGPFPDLYEKYIVTSEKTIAVPKRFYKAIIGKKPNSGILYGIAFIFSQKGYFTYTTIDNLELLIKKDLFFQIPSRKQRKAEKMLPTPQYWPHLEVFSMSQDKRKCALRLEDFLQSY